jgi:predicted RNA-binding protein with PIN domain
MELNKLKIKLQYADDRAEKDASNLRDKQNQVEGLIKDYEEQIAGLDQTINTLRLSEKELSTKLQKVELELIKSEEKYERTKKDVKLFE